MDPAYNALHNQVQFIQQLRQNPQMRGALRGFINEQRTELRQRTQEIATVLSERQEQAGGITQELVEDVEAVPLFSASRLQFDNLSKTAKTLDTERGKLFGVLAQGESELHGKRALTRELSGVLNQLKRENEQRQYPFQAPIRELGYGVSTFVSTQTRQG